MERLQTYFYITVSDDHLVASLYCSDEYHDEIMLQEEDVYQFLNENKIKYGIDNDIVKLLTTKPNQSEFPFTIATGSDPQHGVNGSVEYELNFSNEIVKASNWNFRDIMTIPTVKTGQKIATMHLPSKGESGMSIYGNKIPAKPGKPARIKIGKNVVLRKEDNTVYATTEGQISVSNLEIHVHSVFEVRDSLSMKIGNLDFIGSIVIRGDVPPGYKVKAAGDIKIFGMVEASTIEAGGSIYISEGLAGIQKGLLRAKENVHIGYINQGKVYTGKDLYVENSILHSDCIVGKQVFCQRGSIIGGTLSAGSTVEAKDIGNRLSSRTEIIFGINKLIDNKEKELLAKKKEVSTTIEKLTLLGEKLKIESNQQNPKIRIMLLKQRNSLEKAKEQDMYIDEELRLLDSHLGDLESAALYIRGQVHSNVLITFGKYKRKIDNTHSYVQMKLIKNEIVIQTM
ncbi:FapA family protein [Virgibacillus necropolis]|uniref:DUF342 domain-containing protein n=1 Tax=Virgibacillus necropolis TaxID=163877 RepID=UPI00384DB4C1